MKHISISLFRVWLCMAVDGNWKLCFPHRMFPVKAAVPGLKGITFPDVCPQQPKGNSVFCPAHLQVAKQRHYPTDLRGFLEFCGVGKYKILSLVIFVFNDDSII